MAKCSFCGNPIMKSMGMLFVRKDGTVYFFCSKKCRKNLLELGRSPFAVKWTAFHQKGAVEKGGESSGKEKKAEEAHGGKKGSESAGKGEAHKEKKAEAREEEKTGKAGK